MFFVFAFGTEKDYDKIQAEDRLSNESIGYLKACEENDDIESCDKIAEVYEKGFDSRSNEYKANIYKGKSCDLRHKKIMSFNTAQEFKKQLKAKARIALSGNKCSIVGDYYKERERLGVEGSLEKAKSFYSKACDLQNGYCEKILSFYDKNSKEYKKLWLKSKMVKGGSAMFSVGEILF